MSLTEENRQKIKANRRAIFELESVVNHNKSKAYLTRSVIAENAALISKNYNAAFLGNRQLANENTEQIFRNRVALVGTLPTSDQVQTNYREAMINKAKLAYLDHRSRLNEQVLSISHDMAALNAQAIAINRRIMEANEAIREFNSAMINENTRLLDGGLSGHAPTADTNAELVAANAAKIAEIQSRANANITTIEELYANTESNRNNANANSKQIAERRTAIVQNRDSIAANVLRVAATIGGN